jgi:hypothetical protein
MPLSALSQLLWNEFSPTSTNIRGLLTTLIARALQLVENKDNTGPTKKNVVMSALQEILLATDVLIDYEGLEMISGIIETLVSIDRQGGLQLHPQNEHPKHWFQCCRLTKKKV